MDQYCAGDENARQHLLSLLFELLEGLPDSQVLAFNLLFNVAVHANMYDEYFPKLGDDQQHPPGHYFDSALFGPSPTRRTDA